MKCFLVVLLLVAPLTSLAVQKTAAEDKTIVKSPALPGLSLKEKLQNLTQKNVRAANNNTLIFDLPVTYNKKVSKWVHYYQTRGQKWFREWLARSSKYMPFIQNELQRANLPTD